jgi:hypothetical protein
VAYVLLQLAQQQNLLLLPQDAAAGTAAPYRHTQAAALAAVACAAAAAAAGIDQVLQHVQRLCYCWCCFEKGQSYARGPILGCSQLVRYLLLHQAGLSLLLVDLECLLLLLNVQAGYRLLLLHHQWAAGASHMYMHVELHNTTAVVQLKGLSGC